jgi:transposase-like protein
MKKHYSATLKAQIIREVLKEEKTMGQIASENGVHPMQLSKWKAQVLAGLPSLFEADRQVAARQAAHEKEVEGLYGEIGRLSTQLAWLKKKSGIEFDK